jgi:tRNA 2-selenouridine synthase
VAIHKININELIPAIEDYLIIDARSEGEYEQAHIPNAISIALFNNEQRAKVGTAYKQKSRKLAVDIGLEIFGKRTPWLVSQLEDAIENNKDKKILVHCWRGGLRSGTMAWLLNLYGYEVYVLNGGYKTFRGWTLEQFRMDYPIKVVGGFTGSAKTEVLASLKEKGHASIDLEGLAIHKGSAFGHIGMGVQHTQEYFENILAMALYKNKGSNTLFVEDESQRIGYNIIPIDLWNTIRSKHVYMLQVPFELRLQHLVEEYGVLSKADLIEATKRLEKNLGNEAMNQSIQFIMEDNFTEAFSILLKYYDKYYTKGKEKRENWQTLCTNIECATNTPNENAQLIIEQLNNGK